MAPATIAAIVFDAVGTLIVPEPSAADVYAAVGRKYGSRRGVPEIAARFRAAFAREEQLDRTRYGLRTSEEREIERWRSIVAAVLDDVSEPARCFEELYQHFAGPSAWRCLPGGPATLTGLAERGIRLGLASNYDQRLRTVLAGLPELAALQCVAISSELGWRKPAREFYVALCRQLHLDPRQVLLVGDDLENDYEGARAAGLQALLLDSGDQSKPAERIERLSELPGWLAQHR